jgi:hypothetical protein
MALADSIDANEQPIIPKPCIESNSALWKKRLAELQVLYTKDKRLFKKKLLSFVSEYPNMGAQTFSYNGKPHEIYRSALLGNNKLCLSALIQNENLKNIIYLYSGDYVNEEKIPYIEEASLYKSGGNTYIRILNFSDEFKSDKEREQLENRVSDVIKTILTLKGPTLIHCVGGWHRTGIVYGVLEKCIQKKPIDKVILNYKKHVGFFSKKQPGVFKQTNVDFLNHFNCSKLNPISNPDTGKGN